MKAKNLSKRYWNGIKIMCDDCWTLSSQLFKVISRQQSNRNVPAMISNYDEIASDFFQVDMLQKVCYSPSIRFWWEWKSITSAESYAILNHMVTVEFNVSTWKRYLRNNNNWVSSKEFSDYETQIHKSLRWYQRTIRLLIVINDNLMANLIIKIESFRCIYI